LAIVFASLFWRTYRRPPPRHDTPTWERLTARITKLLIYALLIALPLSKIMRDAFGIGWVFFSISIPAAFPYNEFAGWILSEFHYYAAFMLIFVSILHVGAAAWHRIVRRDDVLSRMLPW
jgi:cytochrome b561